MFRSILLSSTAVAVIFSFPIPAWSQAHAPGVESIVVTATPLTGANLATIPTQVDADQILHQGGSSLADALSNIPGVSSTGFAAGASRPIIRGMDANRVRILENGTSSSDASDIGPDHGVPIDPISTRSIEVVRGAGTLRYGSQAIGGADAGRGGGEGSGMDQFLAQPALIHRIEFERRLGRVLGMDLGHRREKRLVDVGLEGEALEEKGQQGQNGDPPSG